MKKIFGIFLIIVCCFSITACASAEEKAIEKGNQLFEASKYDEALDMYTTVNEEDSTDYESIEESIYLKGVELFENDLLEDCYKYMSEIEGYKDADAYKYIASVQNCNLANTLATTKKIMDLSCDGFVPATELLDKEPFVNYLPLVKMFGLYRSDRTFTRELAVIIKENLYSYIHLDSEIKATPYTPDAEQFSGRLIDAEMVDEKADKDLYKCECKYVSPGVYMCNAKYTDYIYGKKHAYRFKLIIEGTSLKVKVLSSTEGDDEVTFCGGRYSKID